MTFQVNGNNLQDSYAQKYSHVVDMATVMSVNRHNEECATRGMEDRCYATPLVHKRVASDSFIVRDIIITEEIEK